MAPQSRHVKKMNRQTMAKIKSVLKMVRINQNDRKLQIRPVKIPPKWGKPTDRNQNIMSSKSGQDTSVHPLLAHSSHAFWRKSQNPQIWHVWLSQNGAKMKKINRPRTKFNQFCRWSAYTNMTNFRPFLPWVLQEMPGNGNLTCFTKSKCYLN